MIWHYATREPPFNRIRSTLLTSLCSLKVKWTDCNLNLNFQIKISLETLKIYIFGKQMIKYLVKEVDVADPSWEDSFRS